MVHTVHSKTSEDQREYFMQQFATQLGCIIISPGARLKGLRHRGTEHVTYKFPRIRNNTLPDVSQILTGGVTTNARLTIVVTPE
jgi:hypothetical protein